MTSGIRRRTALTPASARSQTLVMPAVLGLSVAVHGLVIALVAVLPPPTYAAAPSAAELEFLVVEPPAEPEPEPLEEPEPEPVLEPEPEPPPRERPAPPPELAPPPPAPVMTTGEAGSADDFVMPPGEEGGVAGGTAGGTGDTVGAEPAVQPAPEPAPEPRGMSRAELRRRLVRYIRSTLHGYVNQRISMPLVARREHLEGTVIVRIRLAQDGRVLGARLSRSSGHDVLDEAAVASIAALSTVPAPPADIPWDPDEELPLPVRYQVR